MLSMAGTSWNNGFDYCGDIPKLQQTILEIYASHLKFTEKYDATFTIGLHVSFPPDSTMIAMSSETSFNTKEVHHQLPRLLSVKFELLRETGQVTARVTMKVFTGMDPDLDLNREAWNEPSEDPTSILLSDRFRYPRSSPRHCSTLSNRAPLGVSGRFSHRNGFMHDI